MKKGKQERKQWRKKDYEGYKPAGATSFRNKEFNIVNNDRKL